MSQDDGSDSEPELVVQPRGHWDKNLGVRELKRCFHLLRVLGALASGTERSGELNGSV